ncbi:hypothetical protein D3C79_677250 [compost metagenome]
MGERPYRRVRLDDSGQCLVFFDHRGVRHIRRRFAGAEDETGVLQREEALGDGHIAEHRQGQRQAEHAEGQALVGEGVVQALFVPSQQPRTEAAVLFLGRTAHEQGAERRCQGQ